MISRLSSSEGGQYGGGIDLYDGIYCPVENADSSGAFLLTLPYGTWSFFWLKKNLKPRLTALPDKYMYARNGERPDDFQNLIF